MTEHRVKRVLTLATIFLTIPTWLDAQSSKPPQDDHSTWLHPSDRAYRFAVAVGFSGYNISAREIPILTLSVATTSQVIAIAAKPPLACAQDFGKALTSQLKDIPISVTVPEARDTCDGSLHIELTHFDPFTTEQVPTLKFWLPARDFFAKLSSTHYIGVENFGTGWYNKGEPCSTSDYNCLTGYEYLDQFTLQPDSAWSTEVGVKFSLPGEEPNIGSASFDFSKISQAYSQALASPHVVESRSVTPSLYFGDSISLAGLFAAFQEICPDVTLTAKADSAYQAEFSSDWRSVSLLTGDHTQVLARRDHEWTNTVKDTCNAIRKHERVSLIGK